MNMTKRKNESGHQSYCAAVRHAEAPCDCEGYGEYQPRSSQMDLFETETVPGEAIPTRSEQ